MKLGFMFLTSTNSFDVNLSAFADALAALGADVTTYFYKAAPPHVRHAKIKVFGDLFRLRCLLDMAFFDRPHYVMGLESKAWFHKLLALVGIRLLTPKFLPDVSGPEFQALYREEPYKFSVRFKDFPAEYASWKRTNADKTESIFSPTEGIRNYYLGLGYRPREAFIVPHGALTDVFKPAPAPHEGFNLMFIGADAVRKGLSYALKAYEKIRPDFPQARLLIVGRFVECREPGVTVIDEALNPAYLTHVPKYFNRADLLVFPSLVDGQPIVVLEALACGVPVITTKGIGFDDLIVDGFNGFLVEKRDTKALEEKIRRCLSHPQEMAQMRENARQTALRHTWMHSAKAFKEQLDALERR